ncbi:transposase [Methanobrevibacter sp. V74]|uniref:transposase n=1 Tax=Methanobrevibacter sp. V74 TaxID=3064279 RepID=UPI003182CCDD
MQKLKPTSVLWEKFYIEDEHMNTKTNKKITYWTNKCKNCVMKEICCKKKNYRTIQDYGNPSKIRMQRKMETEWAQKIYKKRSKTAELPFAHIKQT